MATNVAKSLVDVLSELDLFQGLTAAQLQEVARRSDRVIFNDGDVVVDRDNSPSGAIVIVDGDARRVGKTPDTDEGSMIEPGSVLAEMAMVVDIETSTRVVAKGRVKALRLDRRNIAELLEQHPDIAMALADRVTARLTDLAVRLRHIEAGLAASLSEANGQAAPVPGQAPNRDCEPSAAALH
ncbi:MAG: cyclic nucleotide-binding domain-containing protein [Hyphomicrobiaceae bacterium]